MTLTITHQVTWFENIKIINNNEHREVVKKGQQGSEDFRAVKYFI